jgi:hypothetical protein
MTPKQLAALQSYISSVVRMMTKTGEHSHNVRLLLDSKKNLEAAFNMPLDYPDLFDDSPPATSTRPLMPDIL